MLNFRFVEITFLAPFSKFIFFLISAYDVKLFDEQDYSEAISKEDRLFFEKEAAKTKMKLNTKSSFDTDGLLK